MDDDPGAQLSETLSSGPWESRLVGCMKVVKVSESQC
jgi:hypothetical protein